MNSDFKNYVLAIALSLGVIVLWQMYFPQPGRQQVEQLQQQQSVDSTTAQSGDTGVPQAPGTRPGTGVPQVAPGGSAVPGAALALPRDAVLDQNARVTIDTPVLSGSINLKGARLDDLRLKEYHETVDDTSPTIILLSPAGSTGAFFTEQGWVAPTGQTIKLPNSQTVWSTSGNTTLTPAAPVTLKWDNGEGLLFEQTFAIDDNYMLTVRQDITNNTSAALNVFPYARVQRVGIPPITGIYVLHEGLVGVINDELQEWDYSEAQDTGAAAHAAKSTGGWLGITDKYWAATLIPDQEMEYTGSLRHLKINNTDAFQADFLFSQPVSASPGAKTSVESRIFAGAKKSYLIDEYQEKLKIQKFELLIDWGWFYFITKPLFKVLHYFNAMVGNFGVAILIVTVLLKLLFFPLQNKSYASMSKMKKLAPEMEKIKTRFPDDRAKQQQAMMEMYKNEQVSPLSGCWPILIQIPVFFALYKVIYVTIEMRHAPFFGWLRDLSAQDPTSLFNLFGLLPFTPPAFLMIGVLPILMGITMWIQMRLNPAPPDPIQAQIFNWMPLFFTFLLATFPAGLVLYWTWNNFLSILQQSYIMKKHGVDINLLGNIKTSLGLDKKKDQPGE
ncbi:MAG: membrane protein insertase YidC [Pseudomonadota bacterium]